MPLCTNVNSKMGSAIGGWRKGGKERCYKSVAFTDMNGDPIRDPTVAEKAAWVAERDARKAKWDAWCLLPQDPTKPDGPKNKDRFDAKCLKPIYNAPKRVIPDKKKTDG